MASLKNAANQQRYKSEKHATSTPVKVASGLVDKVGLFISSQKSLILFIQVYQSINQYLAAAIYYTIII